MLSFFPRGVLDEILILIESVSEDFPSYSYKSRRSAETQTANVTVEYYLSYLLRYMMLFVRRFAVSSGS